MTQIEIIFNGQRVKVDLFFLKEFLNNCREVRFNIPELNLMLDYNQIIEIIKDNDYIDFVIVADKLNVGDTIIKNVFINLGLNDNELELLFFFDLKDLGSFNSNLSIDLLRSWTILFQDKYRFDHVVCQIDNGNKDEYYFDSDGLGPLYNKFPNWADL